VEKWFRVERAVLILVGAFAVSYLASGASNVGVLGLMNEGVGKRAWAEAVTCAYVCNALNYGAATMFLLVLRRTALAGR
jgi:hypothetical protein